MDVTTPPVYMLSIYVVRTLRVETLKAVNSKTDFSSGITDYLLLKSIDSSVVEVISLLLFQTDVPNFTILPPFPLHKSCHN